MNTITYASKSDLGWTQVFSIGVPTTRRTTRSTVRAGPTFCLRLQDNEILRISVKDPDTALRTLAPSIPTHTEAP